MKILVAGAGHGGLVAAALLAQKGMDVTVFERGPEENLGYDWTDIFNFACLDEVGIPWPEKHLFHKAEAMTFNNPACTTTLAAPGDTLEMCMERRDILRHLIGYARDSGATLAFETAVEAPLIEGDRAAGLIVNSKTGRQEIHADLVIDAAGMHSPVRSQLPEAWGIPQTFRRDQYFTIFRAFYAESGQAALGREPFNVYFYPLGRMSITWIAREEGYVDMMCGSLGNTDAQYAEEIRQSLLARHPEMGDEILRGGQVAHIPVRRPISRMVANGYAAIGDSAGMTVPLIGSGICNSIRAAKILAETVLAADVFSVQALWPYQVRYMHTIGAANATLDVLKKYITTLKPEQLDDMFERRILESGDMTKIRTGRELSFTPAQLAVRGVRGMTRLPTLLGMAGRLAACKRLKRQAMKIPAAFDETAVRAWAAKYLAIE